MRVNIYRYLIFAAFSFAAMTATAQNLDPTVVVDRAYEGKLMEVHKPLLEMAVPDSVMRFDLDFDYSVFENPYKGSYEFNPYLLSMKPAASADGSKKFYLRAGAGYSLHPELDLVWSPDFETNDFSVDVIARHKSYIGDYLNVDGESEGDSWSGHDLYSTAGAVGHGDWDSGYADFWATYSNIAVKDRKWNRMYNALDAGVSVGSKDMATAVDYRFDARYRNGGDVLSGNTFDSVFHNEQIVDVDASVGFPVGGSMLFFDLEADYAFYGGEYKESAGQFGITPHYVYRKPRFMVDFGVKVAKALGNDEPIEADESSGSVQHIYRGAGVEQIVYPDVTMEFVLIHDALKFKLHAGGGNRLDTYSSVIGANHHVWNYVPDFTIERLNASAGFEGRISSRFSYNLYGGYSIVANGLLDRVEKSVYDGKEVLNVMTSHTSYAKMYAGLDFLWKGDAVKVDGSMVYSSLTGDALEQGYLEPAALTGDVAFEYNWKRRVFAGVDCRFATMRNGTVCSVPGYADLGVFAEYAFRRNFSVWARGGNLLGMNIQRNPLYAEKGAYFTLGICLNL